MSPPVAGIVEESAEDLYDHAPCGYLSTDPGGAIVRVNATLLEWLGYERAELIDRRLVDLLRPGDRIFHETHYAPLLRLQGEVREIAVEFVRADGSALPALINSVLVSDPDGTPRVIRTTVFDASDRRAYERELLAARRRAEESEANARLLARTLQETLLPPESPSIPGLDVAGVYRPAGTGDEVGGDFYDVFPTGRDDWGVVLGDVSGRGVPAATTSTLARYTVRAVATQSGSARAVLATLNQVLMRDGAERLCTAVFARIRRTDDGWFRMTASAAGHPPPLRLSGGQVDEVCRPGTALGIVTAPTLHERTVGIDPGEIVVLCTDGVTRARRDAASYGEERLTALLADVGRATAAEIADRILMDVLGFCGGRLSDDLAIVVLRVPR